jgi:hypothetical protein
MENSKSKMPESITQKMFIHTYTTGDINIDLKKNQELLNNIDKDDKDDKKINNVEDNKKIPEDDPINSQK